MIETVIRDGKDTPMVEPIKTGGRSLMTPLGIAGGEILTYLEEHGATAMRRLIRELAWPAPVVMMAVGALIREGLVCATQHDLEVILEPAHPFWCSWQGKPRWTDAPSG